MRASPSKAVKGDFEFEDGLLVPSSTARKIFFTRRMEPTKCVDVETINDMACLLNKVHFDEDFASKKLEVRASCTKYGSILEEEESVSPKEVFDPVNCEVIGSLVHNESENNSVVCVENKEKRKRSGGCEAYLSQPMEIDDMGMVIKKHRVESGEIGTEVAGPTRALSDQC
ncbi:unnamed protein product [Amaranthus hypochondriacus]